MTPFSWRRLASAAAVAVVALGPPTAGAQAPGDDRPRIETGVGGLFVGPMPLGSSSADLLQPDGRPLPLFRAETSLRPGPGIEAHLSRRVGPRWAAEVSGAWALTAIRTRASGDVEDVPSATLTAGLFRFSVQGSALWSIAATADREVFLRAGAGWMRELTRSAGLARDGVIGTAGVGVKYWRHRSTPGGRRWGVRLEGRAVLRARGVALGAETVRVAPAAAADVLFGF